MKNKKEIWKDIPGLPFYQASSKGRIRSLNRIITYKVKNSKRSQFCKGQLIKFKKKINGAGYYGFWGLKDQAVHRCVYSAFYGKIPKNKSINHKNFNKLDNRIENLELVTFSYQIQHALKNGRMDQHIKNMSVKCSGSKNPRAKLTAKQAEEIYKRHIAGETLNKLSKEFKMSSSGLSHLKKTKWFEKELRNNTIPPAIVI